MNLMRRMSLSLLTLTILLIQSGFAQERCTPPPAGAFEYGTDASANVPPAGIGKTTAQWSTMTKIPVAKKYHTIASFNGDVYVFAGVTLNWQWSNSCYKYNLATDKWTRLADFPVTNFIHGQAHVVNGKIYILGGLGNQYASYKVTPNVWMYDPAANKFADREPMPFPQGWGTSGMINGRIYYIAGSGAAYNTFVKQVQVYDVASDTWDLATDYPKDVNWLTAVSVNNKMIVSGGYNLNYTPYRYIADTYVGEETGGVLTWTKVNDYPMGAAIQMSGVAIGDNAYFFGGTPGLIDNNKPASQRAYRYVPSTDTWDVLPFKPTGVRFLNQAGTDGSKIISPGGEDSSAASISLDVNEVFDPVAQAAPLLVLSDTSIFAVMKRANPVKRTLVLKNNGAAALTWNAAINPACSWVSLSTASGSIGTMGSKPIDLNFSSTGVTSGSYNTNIVLTTNDASHLTTTIPILFVLQDEDLDTDMNVLLEEGTGTWCGYCPYGGDSAKAIVDRYKGRVISIAYHGGSATEPMLTPFTDPWTKLVGLTGWPGAAINRMLFAGQTSMAISRDIWDTECNYLLTSVRSPLTLRVVDGGCNPATHGGWMTVEIFFHQPLSANLRLSIAQVEDSLNWTQTYYPSTGGTTKLFPYYHENVLRQLTPNGVDGEIISSGNLIQSQSTITKTFFFNSKDSARANNRFIIFAHIAGGQILQVIEYQFALLSDAKNPAAVEAFALSQNYPNPFGRSALAGNPSTTITYSLPQSGYVSLIVTDMLGREVKTIVNEDQTAGTHSAAFDGSQLPSGVYQYTIKAGSFVQTKIMILMK